MMNLFLVLVGIAVGFAAFSVIFAVLIYLDKEDSMLDSHILKVLRETEKENSHLIEANMKYAKENAKLLQENTHLLREREKENESRNKEENL